MSLQVADSAAHEPPPCSPRAGAAAVEPARNGEAGSISRWSLLLGVVLFAAVLVAGFLLYPGSESEQGATPSTPSDEVPPGLVEPSDGSAALTLPEPVEAKPVLGSADAADPAVATRRLKQLLPGLVNSPKLGRHVVVQVATPGSDHSLWTSGSPASVTPASTMKLLTSLSVLSQLGPDHRFETKVVAGGRAGQIILVGGGDPLLTDRTPRGASGYPVQATLTELAGQTARALRADGRSAVSLGYDASLFVGPAVNPRWEPSYIPESIVSPISALWVNEGRAVAGLAQRVADPSGFAAQRFVGLLKARGIAVRQPPRAVRATADAVVLASVKSAPLSQIVTHVLQVSDNEGAEVLLRQTAIGSGRPGSAAAGTKAVRETLASLDVSTAGARLYDGSGLSRQDQVPIATLVQVLLRGSDPAHPDLRSVVSGLPVAGFSGSLDYRFTADAPAGLGVVRAKTGTLTGVHGLAGVVTTRLGHVLAFAAVADGVPVRRTLDARAQLDRIAAALATCRC